MSERSQVYGFETILPVALKAVFTAREVKAFTMNDVPDLKRDRPRTEIIFRPGPGQGRWKQITVDEVPSPVETSWKGEFELTLVTAAVIAEHMEYLAFNRMIMHGCASYINGVDPMQYHRVQPFFKDSGTVTDWTPQDGCFLSRMTFEIDLSIQDDALDLIY